MSKWQLIDAVRSREKGVLIPGWQRGRLKAFRGLLLVKTEYVHELLRYTRVARIHPATNGGPTPQPLWDAQPVENTLDYWTYTGTERVHDGINGFIDFAQTWYMVPAREESHCGYAGSERL